MNIIKKILVILVGIVFFIVGFVGFAPVLVISAIFRMIAGFFTFMLFCGLMCLAKAFGTANHIEAVDKSFREALETL